MSYHVTIAASAARQLHERLPEAVAWACFEFIRGPLAEEPRRVGAPLRSPYDGHWRARRGEYRVRYTIDDDAKTVTVLDIDHRRGRLPPLTTVRSHSAGGSASHSCQPMSRPR